MNNSDENTRLSELESDILVFLEEELTAQSSMKIKEEMKGLGYDGHDIPMALKRLKKKGKVNQLRDNDGKPFNKYEVVRDE